MENWSSIIGDFDDVLNRGDEGIKTWRRATITTAEPNLAT
jgi:hypothetical protein